MAKPLSQHMTSLIRNLTDAQLAERIAAFERTKKSWDLLAALKAERNRRHVAKVA